MVDSTRIVRKLRKDSFAVMWLILIISLALMTYFLKSYVKDMIVISILFLIFKYLEPLIYSVHKRSATTILSGGHSVPTWKRFPIFFLEILLAYIIYGTLQTALDTAFPSGSINIVFVALWVGFLFLLWVVKFSRE